jgi:hypothetical protein
MAKKANIAMAGGLVVGAVGANFVSNQATKMLPAVGKFAPAVPLILGYFLSNMKGDFAKAAGAGMIAAGGAKLLGGVVPALGISEDLTEELFEDLSEDVLTEDLSEDMLFEDLSEDVLTEDLSEDVLTEDLSEDMLFEDLTEDLA